MLKLFFHYLLFYYLLLSNTLNRKKLFNTHHKLIIFKNKKKEVIDLKHGKYIIHGNIKYKYIDYLDKLILEKPFILELNQAWLLGKGDVPVVLDNNFKIILESVNNHFEYLYYSQSLKEILYRKYFNRNNFLKYDKIIYFLGPVADNPYHWLIEYLPRIQYIYDDNKLKDYKFLLNNNKIKFQLEILKMIGVDNKQIIHWDKKDVLVEKLIIPSLRFKYVGKNKKRSQIYSQESIKWIRNIVLNKNKNILNSNFNKIFISRKKSKNRRIINEDNIFESIEKKGFIRLFLEDLSQKEIINYFRFAEIVISVHGASLANMIYSKNLKIIELFPSNFEEGGSLLLYQLSSLLNFEHHVLIVNTSNNDKSFFLEDSKLVELINKIEHKIK